MIKLYNTLTRKKEDFKPIKKNQVGLYTCGLTVYNYAHIGNLRTYIFEDILKRVLLYRGYKIKHVENVTDVGHLTSDADEGEDKLMRALKREGKPINKISMLELSKYYTKAFYEDRKKLNILKPDIICKASEHIKEMIELIKKIEKNGYTYKTNVGLIFDTSKFKNYTKLAKLKLEKQKFGKRVEIDPERKNPSDFALWLTNQPNHIMQWDSPWNRGFPGWHVECSAMSMKYLGKHFDIHCGGIDHIPVHHTNEIAQSEAATGKKWVNYWLHGNFLVLGKDKMAKSTGEFITIQNLIDKKYNPLVYRYLTLTAHYRSELTFNWEVLKSAQNAYNNLKEKIKEIKANPFSKKIQNNYKEQFITAINDDLNMPQALAVLWNLIKDNSIDNKEKYQLIKDFDKVFALDLTKLKEDKIPQEILKLAKKRELARKNKDFKKADQIRNLIRKKGYQIEDSEIGFKIKK